MKKFNTRFRKAVAAIALALTALVAVPATAQAVGYVPDPSSFTSTPPATARPGDTITVGLATGSVPPFAPFTFTLTGERVGPGSLATLLSAELTSAQKSGEANGDGSLQVSYTLPVDASGTYTATLAVDGWSQTWTTVIVGAAGGSGAGAGLAETGASNNNLLWVWVAGGALAFVGGGLVVASAVRKQRRFAE